MLEGEQNDLLRVGSLLSIELQHSHHRKLRTSASSYKILCLFETIGDGAGALVL